MNTGAITTAVAVSTVLSLGLWTSASPFEAASAALDRAFGAMPAWTQVRNVFHDPDRQELSGGERPLASFARLGRYWDGAERAVFIGNSQMQVISLASGERPASEPEKTWVDLVTDRLQSSGDRAKAYRLSAAGMTYAEALWYVLYLLSRPELTPDSVFLQMNYQSMWNNGVRPGMLELLSDPAFRASIAAEAARGAGYSTLYQSLLFARRPAAGPAPEEDSTPAAWLEASAREKLGGWKAYRGRGDRRDAFLDLLYRARIYFLGLKPSTARSISETRLLESESALERIAELCRVHGIRLTLLQVPTNPRVSLYRTPADRAAYVSFLERLAQSSGAALYDFENLVPAAEWGLWYNGPDPLHMSRAGHHLLATRVFDILQQERRPETR